MTNIEKISVGERLKQLRTGRKFTQQYVAEYLKISRATYTRYETNTILIPTINAIALAELYKCSVDYLLGRYN